MQIYRDLQIAVTQLLQTHLAKRVSHFECLPAIIKVSRSTSLSSNSPSQVQRVYRIIGIARLCELIFKVQQIGSRIRESDEISSRRIFRRLTSHGDVTFCYPYIAAFFFSSVHFIRYKLNIFSRLHRQIEFVFYHAVRFARGHHLFQTLRVFSRFITAGEKRKQIKFIQKKHHNVQLHKRKNLKVH